MQLKWFGWALIDFVIEHNEAIIDLKSNAHWQKKRDAYEDFNYLERVLEDLNHWHEGFYYDYDDSDKIHLCKCEYCTEHGALHRLQALVGA